MRVQDPLPAGVLPAASPFTQVGWFTDPKLKNAYSMQWNAGVQHQLNASTTITANYVGSGTRNLDIGGFYNTALTPGPGNPQSRSLYPYIAPTNYDRSWGRSNYNAFQFLLNRRFSGGLAAMVSYTWAKSIDIGCSGWYVEGCAVQDPYHFNNDRSVSGFDLTHMMTVNWVYRLPFGGAGKFRTGSRVADYIVGNWQVNGIALLRSGQPFGLDITGDIANTGNKAGYMRPNVVGDHRLDKRAPERWFNTAAFAVPPSFAFGSMGRYALRSDWVRNFDLSVFREFPIREGKKLEFRVESFNTFNTPVFGIPTTSMNSPNFGRVLGTANSPRELQMSLRLTY